MYMEMVLCYLKVDIAVSAEVRFCSHCLMSLTEEKVHERYTGGVSIAISRFRQALTLCYNEQTPNPYRWVWLTVVLANVKNKSS